LLSSRHCNIWWILGKMKLGRGEYSDSSVTAQGYVTDADNAFYAESAAFDSFSNAGKDLILQYRVLFTKEVQCGGAYLKLGPKMDDQNAFGGETKYNIMFGPDRCGHSKKTHLIFRQRNGEKNVLKRVEIPYRNDDVNLSHLYRMTLKPDNTVIVHIDEQEVFKGTLTDDWDLLEPKEIPDESDVKPSDWVDEPKMADPKSVKPDDWVEVKRIVDPNAKQPEDWDTDEDGAWEAPMIDNPAYKGEWKAEEIDNPDYKGPWVQKKVPNPNYKPDPELYLYEDNGFVGFENWMHNGQALIDDVIITDSVEEADELAKNFRELKKKENEKKQEIDRQAADKVEEEKEEAEFTKDEEDEEV